MVIQQMPRVLTHSMYSLVAMKQKYLPTLLPRMLHTCIFHLARISSTATARDPKFHSHTHSLSSISFRHFSISAPACAVKKTSNQKLYSGSSDDVCQVFDQKEMLIGQMTVRAAEVLAKKQNLKLVDIGKNAEQLLSFRLVDGRGLVKERKRQSLEKKSLKQKEFRMTSTITDHDLEIKIRQAKDALSKGNQVKFVIKARWTGSEEELLKAVAQVAKKVTAHLKDSAVLKEGIKAGSERRLVFVPLSTEQAKDPAAVEQDKVPE